MAQTAIRAKVDQTLDRHADLATQIAFDAELGDFLANLVDFSLGQILDLGGRVDAGASTQTFFARERPMPKMLCKPITTCF